MRKVFSIGFLLLALSGCDTRDPASPADGTESTPQETTTDLAEPEMDLSDAGFIDASRCMAAEERLATLYGVIAEFEDDPARKSEIEALAAASQSSSEEFGVLIDQMVAARPLDEATRKNISQKVASDIEAIEANDDIMEVGEGLAEITDQCDQDYVSVDVEQ